MKKFYWTLATIASLCVFVVGAALLTNVAIADSSPHVCTPKVECLTAVDTTSAQTCTITRSSGTTSMGVATFYLDWDDNSGTVTQMDMTGCEASDDKGTTWFAIQDCAVSSGVCTSTDASWEKTLTLNTDDTWVWRVDIEGYQTVRCTFDDGAGTANANDELDVSYQLCVKG